MNFLSKKQVLKRCPENSIGFGDRHNGIDVYMNNVYPIRDAVIKIIDEFLEKVTVGLQNKKVVFMDIEAWENYCINEQKHELLANYDKIILILDAQNVKSSLNLHYVSLQKGLIKYSDCVLWDNYNYKTLNSFISIVLNELVDS